MLKDSEDYRRAIKLIIKLAWEQNSTEEMCLVFNKIRDILDACSVGYVLVQMKSKCPEELSLANQGNILSLYPHMQKKWINWCDLLTMELSDGGNLPKRCFKNSGKKLDRLILDLDKRQNRLEELGENNLKLQNIMNAAVTVILFQLIEAS